MFSFRLHRDRQSDGDECAISSWHHGREHNGSASSFVWLWKVVAYKFALSAALHFYMAHT